MVLPGLLVLNYLVDWSRKTNTWKLNYRIVATSLLYYTPYIALFTSMPLLACVDMDSAQVLLLDMSVTCWTGSHIKYIIALVLPFFLINVIAPMAAVTAFYLSLQSLFPSMDCRIQSQTVRLHSRSNTLLLPMHPGNNLPSQPIASNRLLLNHSNFHMHTKRVSIQMDLCLFSTLPSDRSLTTGSDSITRLSQLLCLLPSETPWDGLLYLCDGLFGECGFLGDMRLEPGKWLAESGGTE